MNRAWKTAVFAARWVTASPGWRSCLHWSRPARPSARRVLHRCAPIKSPPTSRFRRPLIMPASKSRRVDQRYGRRPRALTSSDAPISSSLWVDFLSYCAHVVDEDLLAAIRLHQQRKCQTANDSNVSVVWGSTAAALWECLGSVGLPIRAPYRGTADIQSRQRSATRS